MFLRLSFRRIAVGFFCLNFLFLLCVYFASWWNSPPDYVFKHPYFFFDLDIQEPRAPDQKCQFPRLHPFDPSIWAYLKVPKEITCRNRQPDLTFIDSEGRLLYNSSEIELSGYQIGKSLFCHWAPVLRDPPDEDQKVAYGNEVYIPKEGCQLPHNASIIVVRCRSFVGFTVYEKVQTHVHLPTSPPQATPRHRINVVIFGLDSLSRLAFIRHLPRTYRYLTEVLQVTVLRGMNKVGDNTFPNLIPLLTGHKGYGDGLGDTSEYFDHWPLIWKNFSREGYGTLWAEDFIQFGLFNYLAKGFRHPPTDHYFRPYWLAVDDSSLLRYSSYMCYGPLPKYFSQLDYLKRFLVAYEKGKRPYFGFSFLAELSHEYTSRISSADVHFENFFHSLKEEGHLENTVLIVMSDHGHRFDSIRSTQVGHIEERLPFYAIYIPPSVTTLQPDAKEVLRLNRGRLVTPFDMHATLLDILQLAATGQALGVPNPETERLGQTLFREVSVNRTCSNASIPVQYCTCQEDTEISVADARAQKAADATVWTINEVIKEGNLESSCVMRTLKFIKLAHLVHTVEQEGSDLGFKIRVMIETDPSGLFESLVSIQNGVAEVIGEVSRISPYSSQSDCIEHVILRKFCYCAHPLKEDVSQSSSQ